MVLLAVVIGVSLAERVRRLIEARIRAAVFRTVHRFKAHLERNKLVGRRVVPTEILSDPA